MTTEYICKFKGDTSQLEKSLAKVGGAVKELQDDEVLIKLNYDGNIAQFNKVFDSILKKHPELTIQFQYDANEKLLTRETEKLQNLTRLKVDIDSGNVAKTIKSMMRDVQAAYDNADNRKLKEAAKELLRYANTAQALGESIDFSFVDKLNEMAEDSKRLDALLANNIEKKYTLFDITGPIDDMIDESKGKIEEFQKYMASLVENGAMKKSAGGGGGGNSGGNGGIGGVDPDELKRIDEEIKIIRSDIEDMQNQMENVTGEAFNRMRDSVDELSESLSYALEIQERLLKGSVDPRNISYHVGDFGDGKHRMKSEGFHRMLQGLIGGSTSGDEMWGILGTGVYHSPSARELSFSKRNPKGYALNIDPRKYNLKTVKTDEEANKLLATLQAIQAYVLRQGLDMQQLNREISATEEHENLGRIQEFAEGLDIPKLFRYVQTVFGEEAISLQEFSDFLQNCVDQVKEASRDGFTPKGEFKSRKYNHADSPITQLMKKLGYEGIDLRGTDSEGYDRGSIVFDLREEDILETFSTFDEMDKYWFNNSQRVSEFKDSSRDAMTSIRDDIDELKSTVSELNSEFERLNENISKYKTTKEGFRNRLDSPSSLLRDVGVIGADDSQFSAINGGHRNKGIVSSDDYTIIARDAEYGKKISKLIPLLEEAERRGANVATIVGRVIDEEHELIYEIQKTVPGKAINENNDEWLEATDEQIQKLIDDIKILRDVGLYVDIGGENVLYDKEQGFSFVDLAYKQREYTTQDADRIVKRLFKGYDKEISNQASKMYERLNSLMSQQSTSSINAQTEAINRNIEARANLLDLIGQGDLLRSAVSSGTGDVKEYIDSIAVSEKKVSHVTAEATSELTKQAAAFSKRMFKADIGDTDNDKFNASIRETVKQLTNQADAIDVASGEIAKATVAEKKYELAVIKTNEELDRRVHDAFKTDIGQSSEIERVAGEVVEDTTALSTAVHSIRDEYDELINVLSALVLIYKKINDYKAETITDGVNSESLAFEELSSAANDAAKGKGAVKKLNKDLKQSADETSGSVKREAKEIKTFADMSQRASKAIDIENYIKTNRKLSDNRRSVLRAYVEELRNGDIDMLPERLKEISNGFKTIKGDAKAAGEAGATFGIKLKKSFGNLVRYMATFASFYKVVDTFRQAFNAVYQLDTALVDLRKTTTMTSDELNQFYFDANNVAKQMGVTTEEIINQASAWSRLGYSSKEAATEMAALSSQFAQISPGMSVENATDGLVSTMKAFHIDVANVEREVMDNVNIIGNRMATTNEEVVEMLKRSSAAMNAANNSLQETIALESAAVQITRNAETTGTAFRTISMRIRGLDEETEEALEDFDMLQGKIADLTKTAKTPGGISLFKDKGKTTYKSTYELLKEISSIYHDLTDKQQAGLLEALAGKRGGQVLAGILDDFSEVERAMNEMNGALGSADKEMEIIEESWQYKLNNLKQTWVGFFQDLIDRGVISDLIDSLTKLSESIIKIIEVNPTGVMTLIGGLLALAKFKGNSGDGGLFELFKGGISIDSLKELASKFVEVKGVVGDVDDELVGFEHVFSMFDDGTEVVGEITGGIESATGAMELFTTAAEGGGIALTSLGAACAWIAGAVIAVAAFAAIWDATTTTVAEVNEEINKTEGRISSINSEIEDLRKLEARTDSQEERLSMLNQELDIQKELLEIERRRKAEETYGSKFSDQFDKDNAYTQYTKDVAGRGAWVDNKEPGSNVSSSFLVSDYEDLKDFQAQLEQIGNTIDDVTEKEQMSQKVADQRATVLDDLGSYYENIANYREQMNAAQEALESGYLEEGSTAYKNAQEMVRNYSAWIKEDQRVVDEIAKALGKFDYSSTIESVFQHAQFDGVKDVLLGWAEAGDLTKEKLIDRYPVLINELEDAGVKAEELCQWLMRIANADPTEGAWIDEFEKIIYGVDTSKSTGEALYNLAKNLTPEQREILLNADIDWTTFDTQDKIDKIQQLINAEGPVEIPVEIMSVSETVDSINTKLKPALDTLGDVYSQVLSGENQLIKGSLGSLDLIDAASKIKTQLDALDEMEGITVDYTAYERLVEVLQDTESTGEDVQNAFNDVATSITKVGINGKESIRTLIEALSDMGVQNATTVVVGQVMQDLDVLKEAGLDLQQISNDTTLANDEQRESSYALIDAWAEEAVGAENAATAAALLKMQMILLNQNALNETDSINELARLANMAGVSTDAITELLKLQADIGVASKNLTIAAQSGNTALINEATAALGALNDRARNLKQKIQSDITDALTDVYQGPSNTNPAGGAGKDAADSYVEEFEKELEKLKGAYDRGEIDLKTYLTSWKDLIDKFFKGREEYAEEMAKRLKDFLEAMKSSFDSAISGVVSILGGRINALTKERDNAIKAIEEEKKAALAAYDAQLEAIDAEIEAIEKQEKAINKTIKAKQKEQAAIDKIIEKYNEEIDKIRKASEERQRELDLAKAMYELQRSQMQRTNLVVICQTLQKCSDIKSNYIG